MNTLRDIVAYARWPVAIGLIVALGFIALSRKPSAPPPLPPVYTPVYQQSQPVSYAAAVARASNSVVNIYTLTQIKHKRHPAWEDPVFRRFFNIADIPQQQRMQSALGSGVIVSEKGYILTNFHVINGADKIVVALQDGREAQATVVGENRERDLAVLRITLDNLQAISIDEQYTPEVGDVVLAIGNPFGIGQTVTQGIVSANRSRNLDLKISSFEDFIQTDADIQPGNSGGALINAYGNLVGINTANLDNTGGISFAIPIDIAMQTLKDVIEFGRVIKGWLGVGAVLLNPKIAQHHGLQSPNGILITGVSPGGPAQKAGLRASDVIIGINEKRMEDPKKAWKLIQESRPGDKVVITFIRGDEVKKIQVTLVERPISAG